MTETRFAEVTGGGATDPAARLLRPLLWWLRLPVALGVRARNALFDRNLRTVTTVPVPVVSVGNLSLGGTGKTPCVEWVARFFRELDVRVVVLSRGYGTKFGRNDEAKLLETNLPDVPHLQGADRVELARLAIDELEAQLLVLDDGFQHRRLSRTLDIVLIDASRPVFSDYLFPRGRLREGVSSLKRAGLVILTRAEILETDAVARDHALRLERYLGRTLPRATHAPLELLAWGGDPEPLDTIRGKTALAFAGVGHPEAFRRTLERLGVTVAEFVAFPDHHAYTRGDVEELVRRAGDLPPGGLALTTQKDFVKLELAGLGPVPLRTVRVGFEFLSGESEVAEMLTPLGTEAGAE